MARKNSSTAVKWQFSPKQLVAMYWWIDPRMAHCTGIIADGSVRSGKTTAFIFGFLMWAMESYNGQNFAMCGKTIKSFERNVLGPMKQIVPYLGYDIYEVKSDHLCYIRSDAGVVNKFYIFGGNDEKSQDLIQGITLAGVFLDEVVLMPESFVNQAIARCSVTDAKVWMNANPEGPTHYVKERFIDGYVRRRMLHLHFTMNDNLSLSEERRQFYSRQWVGMFYRRYILGEWCLADGLVYSVFDRDQMTFSDKFNPREYEELIVAVDYGIQNPTAYLLMGYCPKRGRVEIIREYYYSGRDTMQPKTDDDLYLDLKSFCKDIDVQGIYVDPSASSFITLIRKQREFKVHTANNDVNPGISLCAQLFSLKQLAVHSSCRNLIAELGTYAWDKEKCETQGEDVVLKVSDHACDAMRYGIYTYFRHKARTYRIGYYSDITAA